MGAAAFWIAIAAVLIAGSWRKKSVEQMRHETVRLLIQQGAELDEEELEKLLKPPPPPPLPEGHPWLKRSEPGHGYRVLRVFGTTLMIGALGVAAMISGIGITNGLANAPAAGIGVGAFVFLLGAGLFYSSRFLPPPRDETPGREM